MSFSAISYGKLMDAVAAGCDRLVHPRLAAPQARSEQRQFLGSLLATTVFISVAAWTLLPASIGITATCAFICVLFCMSALLAAAAALGGRLGVLSAVAALVAAPHIALLVAAGGGLRSPMALMLVALPVEMLFISATRRSAVLGAVAVAIAVATQGVLANAFFPGVSASAWHWIVPLLYLLATMPRILGRRASSTGFEHDGRAGADEGETRLALRFANNGDLLDADETRQSLLGVESGLLLGAGFFERVHVADRVTFLCAFADLRGDAAPRKVEVRVRVPSPQSPHATSNYWPVAIDLKRSAADASVILGTMRDNREVADLRSALAAATSANEQADFAKGRFLAAVSHELRTPLNSIIGFSDMLLHEVHGAFADPRQKENVAIIREAGNHLLAVVNSVLDVSKIESGCYATVAEPFRFHEAVNLCIALMRMQAEAKGISISTNADSRLGDINADRRAVQQILINLLSNAIKFTPAGGKVRIMAERAGTRLHFTVSDDGIGISDDDLERIGQPFAQVQNDYTRAFEGTGLGLALVKGLVALHEGTMSIESGLGSGTRVTVGLPIAGPAGETANAGVLRSVGTPINGKTDGTLRKAS